MVAPIKHLNQLIKLSRITINIQAGVCKLNSAEMFPPGAGLDTPGIDLKTYFMEFLATENLLEICFVSLTTGMLLNNKAIYLIIFTSIPHCLVFIPVKNVIYHYPDQSLFII